MQTRSLSSTNHSHIHEYMRKIMFTSNNQGLVCSSCLLSAEGTARAEQTSQTTNQTHLSGGGPDPGLQTDLESAAGSETQTQQRTHTRAQSRTHIRTHKHNHERAHTHTHTGLIHFQFFTGESENPLSCTPFALHVDFNGFNLFNYL